MTHEPDLSFVMQMHKELEDEFLLEWAKDFGKVIALHVAFKNKSISVLYYKQGLAKIKDKWYQPTLMISELNKKIEEVLKDESVP